MFETSHERHQFNLRTNKTYKNFCDFNELNEQSGGLQLNAFLIMPIQRSPRYVLLLESLVQLLMFVHLLTLKFNF